MDASYRHFLKHLLLAFTLLLGLSAHAQELGNEGQPKGWGWDQRITISNQDGRPEEFWLSNGEVWHRWRWKKVESICQSYIFWWCTSSKDLITYPWSHDERLDGYLYNITLSRRADGRLEIAGIGGDHALYIKAQNCLGCAWGGWERRIEPSVTNSAWQTLQVKIVGTTLRYETQTFNRACSASYSETEGARGCVLGFGWQANIAQGKPAFQSSQFPDNGQTPASNAVDGKLQPRYAVTGNSWVGHLETAHTNIEDQPWWRVDLKGAYKVSVVRIWQRVDCCMDRLRNFDVELIDQSGVVLESKRITVAFPQFYRHFS